MGGVRSQLGYVRQPLRSVHRKLCCGTLPAGPTMMPLFSHELLATVAQLLCYFCTAFVVVWGLLIAQRG
jgi:hypothetical protein